MTDPISADFARLQIYLNNKILKNSIWLANRIYYEKYLTNLKMT